MHGIEEDFDDTAGDDNLSDETYFTPSVVSDESTSTHASFQEDSVLSDPNGTNHPIHMLPSVPQSSPYSLYDYSMALQPTYWSAYPPDTYLPHAQPVYDFTDYTSNESEMQHTMQENYALHPIPTVVAHAADDIADTTEDITFAEAFTALANYDPPNPDDEKPEQHDLSNLSNPAFLA